MGRVPRILRRLLGRKRHPVPNSVDHTPWRHPFLSADNLRRFKNYSAHVWQLARECHDRAPTPLSIAFCVTMAQNTTKWARLSQDYGAAVALYPHPMDVSALNAPEWEVFDGESADLADGRAFLRQHPELNPGVDCRRLAWDGELFANARFAFEAGDRVPYYRLVAEAPGIRHELLLRHGPFGSYYLWARELQSFDVSLAAGVPIASYLSGCPYCAFSVGGDLELDCGRADALGEVLGLSFNAAHFLILGNPHPVAHCRRLGFANAIYLPYPMDDHRYCPGEPKARPIWEQQFGPGFYVLSSARVDHAVKGNGAAQLRTLMSAAHARPQLRFVFLSWGKDIGRLQEAVRQEGLGQQFIFLPPVGKQRLIDYYRSADAILDQFVYGYYGATALEAAAVGKPIIMRIRAEHYGPLYEGDVAPVLNCPSPDDVGRALLELVDRPGEAHDRGRRLRQWLVRHHGRECTMPVLLGLLRMAATRTPLPADLVSPLRDPLSEAEEAYHHGCMVEKG
jgi:glycosyltransferase involved in cell wall biosynthesis